MFILHKLGFVASGEAVPVIGEFEIDGTRTAVNEENSVAYSQPSVP